MNKIEDYEVIIKVFIPELEKNFAFQTSIHTTIKLI